MYHLNYQEKLEVSKQICIHHAEALHPLELLKITGQAKTKMQLELT